MLIRKDIRNRQLGFSSIIRRSDLLLFMIWPLGALIHAFRYYRWPGSKVLFWLFCIFFGFLFIYADPYTEGAADSARTVAKLIALHQKPIDLGQLISMFYDSDGGYTDLYQPITLWITAFFTDDPRYLFMIYAIVFGYFYSQNIWLVLKVIDKRITVFTILYLIAFILINPIWNINGVRMNTAMHVFLYGLLTYLLFNDKSKLLWCGVAIFIHFSFVFPLISLIIYLITPRKTGVLFILYVVSMMINIVDLEYVRNLLSFLPGVFQSRVTGYTNLSYYEAISLHRSSLNLQVILVENFGKWLIHLWVFVAYLKYRTWIKHNETLRRLFNFVLLFGAMAGIASLVPSGGRFTVIISSIVYVIVVMLHTKIQWDALLQFVSRITLIPVLFIILFQIRMGFQFMGVITLLGNPVLALFVDKQTPFIEQIKGLLTLL